MRRARLVTVGELVLTTVAFWGPAATVARAAELVVEAPPSCLDATSLAEEVSTLVGKPLASVAGVDFRVVIASRPRHRWHLRLDTLDTPAAGGGGGRTVRGSRELDAASCAELAEAASVAIAVSLRSLEDQGSGRSRAASSPDGAAAVPPGTVEARPPAAATSPATRAAATSAPPAAWRAALVLAFASDTGALPNTGLGFDLEGHAQRGSLRLVALATGFRAQNLAAANNPGGSFQLLLGGVLGCWGRRWGRWTPLACAGVELGRLRGTGLGVARPLTGSALWRAGRADVGAVVAVGANAALVFRAGMVVPLTRPQYVVDQSLPVYRPGPLTARITAGLELGF